MKYTMFFLLVFFISVAESQIKEMNPTLGEVPDLSIKRQKENKLYEEFSDQVQRGERSWDDLSDAENELFSNYEFQGVWDVIGEGDNWYDYGGPYKVTASSSLAEYKNISYAAENAHDLNYKTAWVEGKKDYGKGEYLTYYFKHDSPRVTQVIVINGYVKTDKAWKENSRIKKMKMYVNDLPYAVLNLKDTKAEQIFSFEPLGKRKDGKELILKFEILEIYKGEKYSDTALTEVYFQGIDVY